MNVRARCIKPGRAMGPIDPAVMDRLASKLVATPDGCLLFNGYGDGAGYGQIWVDGVACWAHRVAYAGWVGPIEDGQEIHHRCHHRSCCQPLHLEVTDISDNRRRTSQNGCYT